MAWDVLGRERTGADRGFSLLFTAILAREAHRRIPVLSVRSLLLETYKTLHVTIAVTQLLSGELGRRKSGTPGPRVHLDRLSYYLTVARMLERQWRRRFISVR